MRHRHHALCRSESRRRPPSSFFAITTQFVLFHLWLGGKSFTADNSTSTIRATGEKGGLQTVVERRPARLRMERAVVPEGTRWNGMSVSSFRSNRRFRRLLKGGGCCSVPSTRRRRPPRVVRPMLFEPVAFPTLRRRICLAAVELLADRSASPRPGPDAAPSALEMG